MNALSREEFQKSIANAQIICSPMYGQYVEFQNNKNPYQKIDFIFPDEADLTTQPCRFGHIAYLRIRGKTLLVAFIFYKQFLPQE
jgi:hypothetical protein